MASAFNLLTSGGARFDKNRFKKDIDLFTGVSPLSTLIRFPPFHFRVQSIVA
jgi:hypothetical protein